MSTAAKINLLDLNPAQLAEFFASLGESSFRVKQLIKWVHQQFVLDFADMTNLSLKLRETLQQTTVLQFPTVLTAQHSNDGTRKWLVRLNDGNSVETVFIPEPGRGTLCVSSQVGCALNCQFCATATQGFNRNLSLSEIIGQLWLANVALRGSGERITNVVMMGMGEPLLNFDNVVAAMDLMMNDDAYGLSKYRVTLSTSGVVPAMKQLSQVSDAALAVSLHAPNDELRTQLVPINKKYPLAMLLEVCRDYFPKDSKRQITIEYVMLDKVNDQVHHAKQLVRCLQGVPAKVNLIPFNPYPGARYQRSSDAAIDAFRAILTQAGFVTVSRKTRGDDIDAACGQLVGEFDDRTQRRKKMLASQQVAAV